MGTPFVENVLTTFPLNGEEKVMTGDKAAV